MKLLIICTFSIVLILSGCVTSPTKSKVELTYSAEVREKSFADHRLFDDLLNNIGGIGFVDQVYYPNVISRTISDIVAVVPYNNQVTGIERWTINHDNQSSVKYIVELSSDGSGGTIFSVKKENTEKAKKDEPIEGYADTLAMFFKYAQKGDINKMLSLTSDVTINRSGIDVMTNLYEVNTSPVLKKCKTLTDKEFIYLTPKQTTTGPGWAFIGGCDHKDYQGVKFKFIVLKESGKFVVTSMGRLK